MRLYKYRLYTHRFSILICFNLLIIWVLWTNSSYIQDKSIGLQQLRSMPINTRVFVITPTYARPSQIADLTGLINALRFIPGIHWIVVEDSPTKTQRIEDLLQSSKLSYTHLFKEMPHELRVEKFCQRGNVQRNLALDLISQNATDESVVYLADDDNRYDSRLFQELKKTKYVSTFPVGFTGKSRYQRCYVNEDTGKVGGFYTRWKFDRTFQVDMAGFAFTAKALRQAKARFHFDVKCGWIENKFLQQLIDSPSDLEPLCNNCTLVYVWHVKTAGIEGGGLIPWTYDSIPVKDGSYEEDKLFSTIVV